MKFISQIICCFLFTQFAIVRSFAQYNFSDIKHLQAYFNNEQESLSNSQIDSLVLNISKQCETIEFDFNEQQAELFMLLNVIKEFHSSDELDLIVNEKCFKEWKDIFRGKKTHMNDLEPKGPISGTILNYIQYVESLEKELHPESSELLRKLKIKVDRLNSAEIAVFFLWKISDQLKLKGRYDDALSVLIESEKLAQLKGLDLLIAGSLLRKADLSFEMGHFEDALNMAIKTMNKLELVQNKIVEGQIRMLKGDVFGTQNNWKQAELEYNIALSLFYAVGNKPGIAEVHQKLGIAFKYQDRQQMAFDNFELSLIYFMEINDSSQLGMAFLNMADIQYAAQRFANALKNVEKAIHLFALQNDVYAMSMAHLLKSNIHSQLNDYRSAYQALKVYADYTETIENRELKQRIVELNKQFELEEKERIIAEQNKELQDLLLRKEIEDQRLYNTQLKLRNYVLLSLSVLLSGMLLFWRVRTKNKRVKTELLLHETELKQAVLRTQMNPHFIFNSMSVIQSYIYNKESENSSVFLVNFSRLMRLILENSSKELIPIDTEIDILERYLLIQKMRFDDRFDYSIINKLSSIDGKQIMIPPMVAQPFLENAIEHGRLENVENGLVVLRISMENKLVKMVIDDNGLGVNQTVSERSKNHRSMATQITKERIELLNRKYGTNCEVKIEDKSDFGEKGTRVTITIHYELN